MALPSAFSFSFPIQTTNEAAAIRAAGLTRGHIHDPGEVERPLSELEDEALQIIWDRRIAFHFEFRPNSLEAIKRWLTDPATETQRNSLHALHLDGLALEAIPPLLSQFTGLKLLNISHNRIRSVPESLKSLSALEVLYLNHNEISSLDFFNMNPLGPQALFPKLYNLNLSNNQIENLHGLLNICRQLRNLDISFNPIAFDPIRDYAIGCELVVIPSRGTLNIESSGIELTLIAEQTTRRAMGNISTILSALRPPRPAVQAPQPSLSSRLEDEGLIVADLGPAVESANEGTGTFSVTQGTIDRRMSGTTRMLGTVAAIPAIPETRAPHTVDPAHPEAYSFRDIVAARQREEQRMLERQAERFMGPSPETALHIVQVFGDPQLTGNNSEQPQPRVRLREDPFFDGPLPRRPEPQPAVNFRDFGESVQSANRARHAAAIRDNPDGGPYLKAVILEHLESLSLEDKKEFEEKMASIDEAIFTLIPFIALKQAVSSSRELTNENTPRFIHKFLKTLRFIQQHWQRLGRPPGDQEAQRTLGSITTALCRDPACIASIQMALSSL